MSIMHYRRLTITLGVLAAVSLFHDPQCRAAWYYSDNAHASPEVLMPWENGRAISRSSDGTIRVYNGSASNGIYSVSSSDSGRTWGTPSLEFQAPGNEGSFTAAALLAQDGEMHLFGISWRNKDGTNPNVDRFLDLWHNSTTDGGQTWQQAQVVYPGYIAGQSFPTQLPSGRIVYPIPDWVANRPSEPPTGEMEVTSIHSDDGGGTWNVSASRLTAPCYWGFNGLNDGADEPASVQLPDGRAWMLMRTQTGRLYESYSNDGEAWSPAVPSRFYSSSSPSALLRLPDDRIVLTWNNCDQSPRVNGEGNYGGRDVLHAAISDDGGRSWHGYREIYRDPLRNSYPYTGADRGTSYPSLTYTEDGHVLMITGQGDPGDGRQVLMTFDPDWLYETQQADDFSQGLDNWSVFTNYGEAANWWQARTQGPELVADPDQVGKMMLHVRRADDKPGDGAVWNFPQGHQGNLEIKLKPNSGHQAFSISLSDHFYQPTDANGALFRLLVDDQGTLSAGGQILQDDVWSILNFDWDAAAGTCNVLANGQLVGVLPLLGPTEGLSYLRLQSLADGVDRAGFYVDSVSVVVSAPEPGSIAMLLAGSLLLVMFRCRRRFKANA